MGRFRTVFDQNRPIENGLRRSEIQDSGECDLKTPADKPNLDETHTTVDRKAADLEKLLRAYGFDVRFFGGSRLTQPDCLNSSYSVLDRAWSIDEEQLGRAEHAALGGRMSSSKGTLAEVLWERS
jgi:hypothetical protein